MTISYKSFQRLCQGLNGIKVGYIFLNRLIILYSVFTLKSLVSCVV